MYSVEWSENESMEDIEKLLFLTNSSSAKSQNVVTPKFSGFELRVVFSSHDDDASF